MRSVVWTDRAIDELDRQVRYIAADSRVAAITVRERIGRAAADLAHHSTGRRGRVAGTYEKVVPRLPYIVVYRIRKAGTDETIRIVRVIHMSRNWPPGSWP